MMEIAIAVVSFVAGTAASRIPWRKAKAKLKRPKYRVEVVYRPSDAAPDEATSNERVQERQPADLSTHLVSNIQTLMDARPDDPHLREISTHIIRTYAEKQRGLFERSQQC